MSFGARFGKWFGLRFGGDGGVAPIVPPIGPTGLLLPWSAETFTIGLQWRTDVITSRNGREYRQALNEFPRESYDFSFSLDTIDARYVREVLKANAARVFHLPIRTLDVQVMEHVDGNTIVADVSLCDWAIVGQRVIIEAVDGDTFSTHITAISGSDITIADVVSREFDALTTRLIPLACCYLDDKAAAGLYAVNVGTWTAKARNIVPMTRLGTGGIASRVYLGRDVIDESPDMGSDTAPEAIDANIDVLDSGGAISASTSYTVANIQRGGQFSTQTAQGRQSWLRFLKSRKGRQVGFWLATHHEDFAVLSWDFATVTVATPNERGPSWVTAWKAELVGKHVRVELEDGPSRFFQISTVTEVGSTTVFYLAGAFQDLVGETITQVSRLELVRLASDEIVMVDESAGLLSFDLPTVVVQQ